MLIVFYHIVRDAPTKYLVVYLGLDIKWHFLFLKNEHWGLGIQSL